MKSNPHTRIIPAALAGALLAACSANGGFNTVGDNSGNGGDNNTGDISDGTENGGSSSFPNDGSTPPTIIDGNGGSPISGKFFCDGSVYRYGLHPTTEVGANGLIGSTLTDLLNGLGGDTVTALLNSISDKDLVIDGVLPTFADFTLTAGGLSALDSIEEIVHIGGSVPSGNFAVFGVSFPAGVLALDLLSEVTVTTYLGTNAQESMTFDDTALQLLGTTVTGPARAFLGLKTHLDYDSVAISLTPSVLSANVGDAMHVHELCTQGHFE